MKRRSLSRLARVRIFDAADGVCHICGQKIMTGQRWDADHVLPLALGGKDEEANMHPAHERCHKGKTAVDVGQIRKADRQRAKHLGVKKRTRTIPGRKFNGDPIPSKWR